MSQQTENYCVIMSTWESREDAEKLAGLLLEKRLAACVQMMPITSFYVWKDERHKTPEMLLLIKAQTRWYGEIEKLIVENHPYEVPEIIRLPIQAGLGSYLRWMDEVSR